MPLPIKLRLPKPHTSQIKIIRESKRFNVLCCGRRFGKTTLGMDRIIHPALDAQPTAWFAPTYKSLAESWREMRRTLEPVLLSSSEQKHHMQLITGGTIEMWSLDKPDIARGRKYRVIVVDEAAQVKDLSNAWQFVIRPTLTDLIGDAWFLSTPRGMNFFKSLYDRVGDKNRTQWASWRMPTAANPYISPAEVEEARRDLTEQAFSQEYLAAFVNWEGSVFRRIEEAATAEQHDSLRAYSQYVFGIDWGKTMDATVVTVIDVTTRSCVLVERWSSVEYTVQIQRIIEMVRRFKPITVIAESNSMGAPVIESLYRAGVPVQPFNTSNATKAVIIEALAMAFERGDIKIIPSMIMMGELAAFAAERLPSGLTRYAAPAGQHDDCVMSLALAWSAIESYRPQQHIVTWESDERISSW